MKKNSGITLIALVITIVVMLILATVAIRLTIGENGIFKRAKQAKYEYANAQVQEHMQIGNAVDTFFSDDLNKIGKIQIAYSGNLATTGEMENTVIDSGTGVNLSDNQYERNGYTFNGWNTQSDGSGQSYTNCENVTFTENTVLYAQWNPITYTITYNLNSGTITNQIENYTADTETFTLPIPKRTGYSFTGWNQDTETTKEINVTIAKGSTGNKTFTANWTAIETKTYSAGRTSSGGNDAEVHVAASTTTLITYGDCCIIPQSFECTFKAGNYWAQGTSTLTFYVDGYNADGEWENLFTKTGTRPKCAGSYTAFTGTENFSTTNAYTNFRVRFNSTDNERYVYASLKIN